MMKRRVFQTISGLCLAGTVLPSVLFLGGLISLEQSRTLLLLATVGWFVQTPFWMGREALSDTARTPE
ncbi:MAG: hypothetical protein VB858_06915 [Planctomycetaceae bacterium]